MNLRRSFILASLAALAAVFAPGARAQNAEVVNKYKELKGEYSEAIQNAGSAVAQQKRVNLDFAKKFAELGSKDRGDVGTYCLLESASLSKEANDTKSAERMIGEARKRGGSWQVKMTILAVAFQNPNQMSLCRDLAEDYIPEAKKDPNKARDLIPFLEKFKMQKEAAALAGASPSKPKKANETASGGGAERNQQGMQLRKSGGGKAKNFSGKDRLTGKQVSLSGLKGKVVLIDFWATWCGPCMRDMPNVKKLYKNNRSKNFALIGVSLDNDLDALDAFLKSEQIEWPQLADGKGWKSSIGQLYGVNSIPHTVLLDGDGNVIAEDLRGAELDKAVEEALRAL